MTWSNSNTGSSQRRHARINGDGRKFSSESKTKNKEKSDRHSAAATSAAVAVLTLYLNYCRPRIETE